MTRLLTLDPGGTTGWGLWEYGDRQRLTHIEHGMIAGGVDGFVYWWLENIERLAPDELAVESFILDGRTAFPDLTPRDIEGALVALWRAKPKTMQRNTYKRHAPDELLKQVGWYWKGPGHDRDAARHAIAYCITHGHMPTIMWLHPPQ